MEPIEYLRIVRRRWPAVLLLVLIGVGLGWVTAPKSKPVEHFNATTSLLINPERVNATVGDRPAVTSRSGSAASLQTAGVLAETGEVRRRAAFILGDTAPEQLVGVVKATVDESSGVLEITATALNRNRARELSDAFTQGLTTLLDDQARAGYLKQVEDANNRSLRLDTQVNELAAQPITPLTEPRLKALQTQAATARAVADDLQALGPPASFLIPVDEAKVRKADQGIRAPDSVIGRSVMLGLIGLAIGIALALVMERLDTKIQTREDAESAFGLPVVAEIPKVPRLVRSKHAKLITTADPGSAFVEPYRNLRSVLDFQRIGSELDADLDDQEPGAEEGNHVILVTSSGPSEGKTTTVAELAALFGENERSVLAVSADFRRPTLHNLLGVPAEPGMSDAMARNGRDPGFSGIIQRSPVSQVRVLASGPPVENPARLLIATRRFVEQARQVADVTLIDTAPIMAVNDAAELLPAADTVVIMARAGRTTKSAAQRAAETLRRLGVPTASVVLIGGRSTGGGYYYQSSYKYSYEPEKPKRGWRFWRRPKAETPPPAVVDAPEDDSVLVASGSTAADGTASNGRRQPQRFDPIREKTGERS